MKESQVFVFEEHSSSLPVWWEYGKQHTVVYLDAHLDLQQTAEEHIQKLSLAKTKTQVEALGAPHHLEQASRFAYGIENFLYAAKRLGLIKRLIWVAPDHIPRDYSPQLLDFVQQMDGITFNELTSFKKIGPEALRGTLLGLDITICSYQALESLDVPDEYLLDIDIDYFVRVPDDQLWVDPLAVVESIISQLGEPQKATISRAVGSGFTPLSFRFVADAIRSQLIENNKETKKYQSLIEIISLFAKGQNDAARERCTQLLKVQDLAAPIAATSNYLLGLDSAEQDAKKDYLAKAGDIDPHFHFDLSRESIGLLHRRKKISTKLLRQLADALNHSMLQGTQRIYAELALGQLLASTNNVTPALSLMQKQTDAFSDHEDLVLLIGAQLMTRTESREMAEQMFRSALNKSKSASSAMLHLGELALLEKDFDQALNWFNELHKAAPAWMLPLEKKLTCLLALDRDIEAGEVKLLINQKNQALADLLG